jgi:hypothetical protein
MTQNWKFLDEYYFSLRTAISKSSPDKSKIWQSVLHDFRVNLILLHLNENALLIKTFEGKKTIIANELKRNDITS